MGCWQDCVTAYHSFMAIIALAVLGVAIAIFRRLNQIFHQGGNRDFKSCLSVSNPTDWDFPR